MKILFIIFSISTFFAISIFGNQKNSLVFENTKSKNSGIFRQRGIVDTSKINNNLFSKPITKTQQLTQKIWRVDFIHHVIEGGYSFYALKGKNTTGIAYENMRFKFNANGTGSHVSYDGTLYKLSWRWLSKDYRKLSLTINGRSDIWQMVEISGNYLHASANILFNNNHNNLETFRLIQVS